MEKLHTDSIIKLSQKSGAGYSTKFLKQSLKYNLLKDYGVTVVSFKFARMTNNPHFEVELLYKGITYKHRTVGGVNNTKNEHIDNLIQFTEKITK